MLIPAPSLMEGSCALERQTRVGGPACTSFPRTFQHCLERLWVLVTSSAGRASKRVSIGTMMGWMGAGALLRYTDGRFALSFKH